MTTYVLVPGAWLGGWCWSGVADALRGHGHAVHAPTLTGLGERADLAGPDVDLDTHIADVADLVTQEDLRDVVLVGHSYAGIVVTGVADRVPERIRTVAYLDSGPVPDGVAYLDFLPPPAQQFHRRVVDERGDGWRLPMFSWQELETVNGASLEGLDGATRRLIRAQATAQPFGTYTQPLRVTNPDREALDKVLIACSFPLDQVRVLIAEGRPWFREMAGPAWRLRGLPTGHWPMFSRPTDLANLLARLA